MARIRLAVDNERAAQPAPSAGNDGSPGRPLPWALCLLIWALAAAAGWGLIALVVHVI